jgi:O-antigen/teichoic acid export membrane protein
MVAIQVYVVLDTTMVGLFAGDEQVGIYSMSQKLVKTLLTIVTAMGVVMIPRMSYHFSRKDNEAAQQSALRSYRFASYASCLFLTPFLSVIPVFVPWFFGQAFEGAVTVIFLCSGVIFFIALNNVLGLQVLIPQNNEKAFSIAVIVGAFVNFFLNLILISLYKANGAALASSIAECVVWAVEMYLLKSFFDVYSVLKINLKDLLAMVLSVFCVYLIPFPEENPVFTIMIQGGFSVLFFMVLQFFNSSSIQKFLINNLLPWRSRDA